MANIDINNVYQISRSADELEKVVKMPYTSSGFSSSQKQQARDNIGIDNSLGMTTASPGKYAMVKTTDANGVPLTWEAGPGGAGSIVEIDTEYAYDFWIWLDPAAQMLTTSSDYYFEDVTATTWASEIYSAVMNASDPIALILDDGQDTMTVTLNGVFDHNGTSGFSFNLPVLWDGNANVTTVGIINNGNGTIYGYVSARMVSNQVN